VSCAEIGGTGYLAFPLVGNAVNIRLARVSRPRAA